MQKEVISYSVKYKKLNIHPARLKFIRNSHPENIKAS